MSDIILTGRKIVTDAKGWNAVVTRIARIPRNKYSTSYIEAKALMDEQRVLEFKKKALERTINEKEDEQLQAA